MKSIMSLVISLPCLLTCGFAQGGYEIIEIPWQQTAQLGDSGCCSWGSSLYNHNGAITRSRHCQTVYGSCVQSKSAAVYIFSMDTVPENATIVSAKFTGVTEYNDQGGNGSLYLKATSESMSSALALQLLQSPDHVSSFYSYGSFSLTVPTYMIEEARDSGRLGLMMTIGSTVGMSILNTGSSAVHLQLIVDVEPEPPCTGDYDLDGVVDGGDLSMLLGHWMMKGTEFDLDGDGIITGADLAMLLGNWGKCARAG